MSENTKKLDLFKYNTETDKKDTFNINLALNNNWDKLENKISISEYDENSIYPSGCWVRGVVDNERKIFESLIDNNQGNNLNNADAWEEISFAGGGLEIGDIGIAPLGIDETKGKRRYLNGQYILQEHFVAFTNKLKNAIAKYSSLACTESEWQTIATMTVGGQVGKFVVDDNSKTIRLPKIIMPIQGLTDLSKLAEIVEAGLPNITGEGGCGLYSYGGTGAIYKVANGYSNGAGAKGQTEYNYNFDASRSNSIYGNSNTVQQEQIQYPYFIQVATGAETKDEIINEHELVNPYVLLEPKFFETPIYNLSWLATGGFNGSKAVHPSAYDALLIELNEEIEVGTTQNNYTKRGLSVKLATESFSDYDFVVDTTNETFRCPLKVKLASGKAVVGNGMSLGLTDGVSDYSLRMGGNQATCFSPNTYTSESLPFKGSTSISPTITQFNLYGVTTDPTKSGLELSDNELYLYFYVGEVAQNTNLINAGRIEEKINDKINRHEIKAYIIETYKNGYSGYRIWSDKYCEQWGLFDYGSLTQDNTGRQITLIKPFANSNYIISGNAFRNDRNTGENGLCAVPIGFFTQTTNSFYIRWFFGNNETTRFAFWKACGYIA